MTLAWPDLIIGAVTIFFALKGFRKGFVSELSGAVAIFVAIVAAYRYTGSFDATVVALTGLGGGSAHALGTIVFAALWYAIVLIVTWSLGRFAKLPVLGLANGILGALLGAAKGLFGAFLVLYVILFFPLSRDLRADLHRSALVQLVTQPDRTVDDTLEGLLPWFMKPVAIPFFAQHHA